MTGKMFMARCPICGQGYWVNPLPQPQKVPKFGKCETERIKMPCHKCKGRWSFYAGFETRPPKGSKVRRWCHYTKAPYLEKQQENWFNRGDAMLCADGTHLEELTIVEPTEGLEVIEVE